MKSFPRLRATRRLTKEDIQEVSPRQADAILEKVFPQYFKARRVRNIVSRTMQKTKSKEFTTALDAVLGAVDQVHDISEQMTAMNPALAKSQRDGTLMRKHNEAVVHLLDTWEKLVALV
jgi:U3 small nucleolar RNA-associated protein 14